MEDVFYKTKNMGLGAYLMKVPKVIFDGIEKGQHLSYMKYKSTGTIIDDAIVAYATSLQKEFDDDQRYLKSVLNGGK